MLHLYSPKNTKENADQGMERDSQLVGAKISWIFFDQPFWVYLRPN